MLEKVKLQWINGISFPVANSKIDLRSNMFWPPRGAKTVRGWNNIGIEYFYYLRNKLLIAIPE